MKNVGYHYFSNDPKFKPLCYNCKKNQKDFNLLSSTIDSCCEEQFDKKKYPNLISPDYSFKNDTINRINYYNKKNYKKKILI